MAVTDARANLSELVASVRLLHRGVVLTQRGSPKVAVVPLELWEAAEQAGGIEAAVKLLTQR